MAMGMSRDAAGRALDTLTGLTDPGDRMRLELHTAPTEAPPVEPDDRWASGGFMASYGFDGDDSVGPVVSEGYVELTIDVIDRFTPRLTALLQMVESMNAVRSSFAQLGEAMSDFTVGWPTPLLDLKPEVDLLYPAVTPQPWARHDREKTSLELAIERWERDNPIPENRYGSLAWMQPAFSRGEASGRDTIDCSSSNGARWSDLMSRIDELTDDAP